MSMGTSRRARGRAGGPAGLLVLLLAVLSALLLPATGAQAAGSATIDPTVSAPTALTTTPGGGCAASAATASWVAAGGVGGDVDLSMTLPAGKTGGLVQGAVHIWDTDGSTPVDETTGMIAGGPGSSVSVRIAVPADGHTIGWYAQTVDQGAYSGPSASCYFRVDSTQAAAPVVSSSDFPPSDSGLTSTKAAMQPGTFEISDTGDLLPADCSSSAATDCASSGLAYLRYSFGQAPDSSSPRLQLDSCGHASLTQAFGWGTHMIYVQAVDNAGNVSQPTEYSFNVPSQLPTPPTAASPAPAACTTYVPVAPVRVLDTRSGTGGFSKPLGAGGVLALPVAGRSGVPTSGVGAVVLNVTATGATSDDWLSVYPDGQARPGVSNLNFGKGQVVANLVTVPVVDGKVDFYNAAGSVNVVADLVGYYTTANSGSTFVSSGPTRVLDTRSGTGTPKKQLGAGAKISLQVAGVNGAPANVTAVAMNVTATGASTGGWIAAYPDGQALPKTSTVNFAAGHTTPNLAIVPVVDGKVDFYNAAGTVDVLADVTGYFTSDGTGAHFYPAGPTRMLDTRNGTGAVKKPVGAAASIALQLAGRPPVPATGVSAVVMNVTVTGSTSGGWVAAYPDGQGKPTTSTLNFTRGLTVANLAITPTTNGKIDFYNAFGTVNVIADLAGYFSTS